MMAINKQNIRHTISPQTHIIFVMPCSKKGLERCHKSGTGNNQGRRRTTPHDNRGFNRNDCHSKSNELSSPVIPKLSPWNYPFINPTQLSSVFKSHPALHIIELMSCKLLQYPVGLLLICQISCHRRPPTMEITIFMDAWLMCLS